MWAKRAQDYLGKINSGELGALAEVVRDLQAAGDGSGSSFSQRNLFELALDRLGAESAAINRIPSWRRSNNSIRSWCRQGGLWDGQSSNRRPSVPDLSS